MGVRFWSDDRGVTTVVGAILVFTIIIMLFAIYQGMIVPNQNEAVEFSHSQTVQNHMLQLRNAILQATTIGETTFAEVKLGTRYSSRIFTVNPPPVTGHLVTSEPFEIIITDNGNRVTGVCPGDNTYHTRFLTYTPDYNLYTKAPTIVYENTVLYLNFSGEKIPLTDQSLVQRNGNLIRLAPTNTSLSKRGIQMVTVEPVPGSLQSTPINSGTISVPTKLSESTWRTLLADQGIPPGNITVSNNRLNITTSADVTIACSPTGLNSAPEGGKREGGLTEINPAGPGDVLLVSQKRGPEDGSVYLKFENAAITPTNITRARFNFFYSAASRSKEPDQIQVFNGTADSQAAGILQRGRDFTILQPDLFFPDDTRIIRLDLEHSDGSPVQLPNVKDGYFVITVLFESGESGTYFIPVPGDDTF